MTMTFGEAMLHLIKKRGLSATAVAEEMGFKSRTAFFRILHDECRIPSVKKCFEAAKESALLSLTPAELDLLKTAMRVNEIGRRSFEINKVLGKMIHPQPESDQPLDTLTLEGMEGVKTVEDILKGFSDGGEVRVVLMGQCEKIILDRMHRLTREANVRQILHFFSIDDDQPQQMEVFSQISSILFSSVYTAHFINESGKQQKSYTFPIRILFFVESPQGGTLAIQLVPLRERHYLAMADGSGQLSAFLSRIVDNALDITQPLKREHGGESDDTPDPRAYASFIDRFRRLEHNRAIYMIKPDFPIPCVPTDILASTVSQGVAETVPEEEASLIDGIFAIHEERVQNLYHKKKPTHIILNVEAMTRFAQTGQRSDHFFLGRPYTVSERVRLLTLLRDQTRDNPNFSIWFSRRPDIVDDKEVTVYDNYGVAMIKADTSWHLEGDHQEIMIESRMLAEEFKFCIRTGILVDEVMSREESIAVLERLIEIAKTA